MIRTLIQYSTRFAGLMLLAALAVTAAPAQSQDKKAVLEKRPVTKDIKVQSKETAKKPAERVLEIDKSPARRATDQQGEQKELFVKKPTGVSPKLGTGQKDEQKTDLVKRPTGVSPKTIADQQGGQKTIAVGEPNGVSRKKAEAVDVAPAGGGRGRLFGDGKQEATTGGPVRGRGPLDGPQKTKDAIGSPQRADQKGDGTATPGGKQEAGLRKQATDLRKQKTDLSKQTTNLRRSIKLEPLSTQGDGKGAVIERKPKEDADDLAKKKAKIMKTDAKLAEEETPSLVRRRNK